MSENRKKRITKAEMEAVKDNKPWKREDTRDPWEKRTTETKGEYELFIQYCKIGPSRSNAKLAVQLGLGLPGIAKISRKNGWDNRARKYDDMVMQLRPSLQNVTIEESRTGQLIAGRLLLDLGIKSIHLKNPALIGVDQATRLIQAGVELERKAIGEADVKIDMSVTDMTRVNKMLEDLDIIDVEEINLNE